ncbi:MAG: BglII/BstYI family type II restriction endonuclease [Clostridia bacterium]|uniref:BglII/BstYI family type II restriction endonuclease n=1 Tax=Desulfosporosinus sp. TaxID=157907 RepID=UPI00230A0393|nr:BglII/BstYI family type II restriction endonuclease [Desulfosporosinus sp.]MDA8212380.1 BglII/BstYI family type II restriction endonuclease [Clostridia bacterium]
MDIVYTYSHLGGEEILMVRHPELEKQIDDVIAAIPNPGRNKKSEEKTKMGKMLYSPAELNALFKKEFNNRGWQELKDFYDIEIPQYPHTVKRAYKQCDFHKEPVLVEVQFGKYAFMFYDLAKFQYFYNRGLIKLGVEIVPCHFLQTQMSSGVSYGEQLIYDLERLSKNFPSVPVKIILVDMPIESDDYWSDGRKLVRESRESVVKHLEEWKNTYE